MNEQTRKAIEHNVKSRKKQEETILASGSDSGKPKQHRNRPDLANYGYENAKPGDNARYLRNALVALELPPIDVADAKQVESRIQQYFEWCISNDQKPKVSGMANWLGVHRDTINSWFRGECRSKTHSDLIKKYYGILEELWESYMQDGTINTVSGIFLGKVMFGYRETSEIVLTPNNPLDSADPETTRRKYIQALPEDAE